MLNDFAEIKVWMTAGKEKVTTIELAIKEGVEIFGRNDFDENNSYNTVKQAYLLIIKWLFDNRFLLLTDDIYAKGLSFNDEEIRTFISINLSNHIWDSQIDLAKESDLSTFLFNAKSNYNVELSNGENINVYARNLFLKAGGVWEEHQRIYNDAYDSDALENIEKSVFLDEEKSKNFMDTLTTLFNYYKVNKK